MMKRATGVHVEMDQEWHRSYDFEMRFVVCVPFITQWCDENVSHLIRWQTRSHHFKIIIVLSISFSERCFT